MSFDAPDAPEPKRSGHHWFDLLISICALITSGLSMYVAYNNDQSLERLVHANSWPFLQFESGNSGPTADASADEIYFTVKNAGTGPARVQSFEFLLDGRPINSSFALDEIATRCCRAARDALITAAHDQRAESYGVVASAPVAPGFLAPHDEIIFLRWRRTEPNSALWNAVDRARYTHRISVRACYCSVFDECWIAETAHFPPRSIHVCPAQAQTTTH